MPRYKLSIKERFSSKYNKSDNGCWNWNGALRKDGYGILKVNGKCVGAHRFSYQLFNGKIPDGLYILHSCDNRICVNPGHLSSGTQLQNILDAKSRGRMHIKKAKPPKERKKISCPSAWLYRNGCRCTLCVAQAREYWKTKYKNKKIQKL